MKMVFTKEDAAKLTYGNIVIPEGFTEIAYDAFKERDGWIDVMREIKSISLPKSFDNIAPFSLADWCDLENITVDKDNPHYRDIDGVLLSKDGSKLLIYPAGRTDSKYTVPDCVTDIAQNAFRGNVHIKSVVLSDNLTAIGTDAFWGCEGLTEIHIPHNVSLIGKQSFFGCCELKSITVAEDNPYFRDIDCVLFNKDMSVLVKYPPKKAETAYTIPEGITRIETCAFRECENLLDITFPSSLRYLGRGAFEECGLINASLPDGLLGIGDLAFCSCSSLESVTIPSSVIFIGEEAFGHMDTDGLIITVLSDNADIERGGFGWSFDLLDGERGGLMLRCRKDSTAHNYAREIGVKCEII